MKKEGGRLYVLPAVTISICIALIPILFAVVISFFDYFLTGGAPPKFNGLENWINLFRDKNFLNSLRVIITIILPAVSIEFILGFVIALSLNTKFFLRGVVIGLLAAPVMIAPAAAGLSFRLLYSPLYGPINHILGFLSGKAVQIDWLGNPRIAVYAIALVDIWQQTPFITLVILAGLSSIPKELYEAAEIDGANSVQVFSSITLPLLRMVVAVSAVIRMIDLIKLFDLVFILTMGGPASSTETISFYSYLIGIRFFRVGYGAAISIVVLLMSALMTAVLLKIIRRGGEAQ